jgi:SNF family Na+-dependent transporter
LRPKVWLAAAGQIFFTLSVGMGTIHCYASYMKSHDDVALNAVATGFTNEFVEIVLGSMIVIPIAAGFLGLDWIKEHIGFGAAFQTMPYLFDNWGLILGSISGLFWFGLLFFAGITSSLAMGMPWISFLTDEFKWKQKHAAYTFGLLVFILGLPTVLFYNQGVFNEYDYWAGTVSLVIFALFELILFSWVFGIKRGWEEINLGADIRIPHFYAFVIRYITPLLLLFVLIGSVITPDGNNWIDAVQSLFQGNGWKLDSSSMIQVIMNKGLHDQMLLAKGEELVLIKQKIALINGARILLVTVFAGIALLVFFAQRKNKSINQLNHE